MPFEGSAVVAVVGGSTVVVVVPPVPRVVAVVRCVRCVPRSCPWASACRSLSERVRRATRSMFATSNAPRACEVACERPEEAAAPMMPVPYAVPDTQKPAHITRRARDEGLRMAFLALRGSTARVEGEYGITSPSARGTACLYLHDNCFGYFPVLFPAHYWANARRHAQGKPLVRGPGHPSTNPDKTFPRGCHYPHNRDPKHACPFFLTDKRDGGHHHFVPGLPRTQSAALSACRCDGEAASE